MTTASTPTRKALLAEAKALGLKGITRLSAEELARRIAAEERVAGELATPTPAPEPEPAPTPEVPTKGPRGELLADIGRVDEATGYIVKLPFREFVTMQRPVVDVASGLTLPEDAPKWLTRCVEHMVDHPATTGAEAEKAGARKHRAEWCPGCAEKAEAKGQVAA